MNKTNLKSRLNEVLPEWTTRDLLTPLFRHKRLVFLVFIAVFGLAIYLDWAVVSKYYVASMQIVVQQHRSDPSISAGQTGAIMNTSRSVSPDQISSEMAILHGEDMLKSVVQACGLANTDGKFSIAELFFPRDPEHFKAARFEKAASSLGKGLKVIHGRRRALYRIWGSSTCRKGCSWSGLPVLRSFLRSRRINTERNSRIRRNS